MLKMLTSYTYEADDPELAVEEILEQLDLEHNLMRHSVGMMVCYSDFVDTGIVKAICDTVPFEVIGGTSLGLATGGEVGTILLSLTVFTSDNVVFSTAVTGSLADSQAEPMKNTYGEALSQLGGSRPSLALVFAPLIRHVGGEKLSLALEPVANDVPVFGTVACDPNIDYHDTYTIHNGKCYREAMSLLLMAGEVSPRFLLANIPEEKIQKQKAIITRSEGNIVHEVNGQPFIDYAGTLGITREDGTIDGMNTIPFIVDCKDGTQPYATAIYTLAENGSAYCGANMPEKATLSIGSVDVPDVLATAGDIMAATEDIADMNGILLFSCLSRAYVLGADTDAELNIFRDGAKSTPLLACYSGGEYCPLVKQGGAFNNHFHNYTLIGCIL